MDIQICPILQYTKTGIQLLSEIIINFCWWVSLLASDLHSHCQQEFFSETLFKSKNSINNVYIAKGMYFHCFGAWFFPLYSHLSLFPLSLSSFAPTLAPLHPCCLSEASGKRAAHHLNAWTLMLLRLNPDLPMAWVPFFVWNQYLRESDMELLSNWTASPDFLLCKNVSLYAKMFV